jgi:hypothetical protein
MGRDVFYTDGDDDFLRQILIIAVALKQSAAALEQALRIRLDPDELPPLATGTSRGPRPVLELVKG